MGDCFGLMPLKGSKSKASSREKSKLRRRIFSFRLAAKDQIVEEKIKSLATEQAPTGTTVTFSGLRDNAYRAKFPTQPATLVKHFGSHFFADFILGKAPRILLDIDGDVTSFPEAITEMRVEDRGIATVPTADSATSRSRASFVRRRRALISMVSINCILWPTVERS